MQRASISASICCSTWCASALLVGVCIPLANALQPNVGAQKSLINALEGMSRGLKIASIAFSAPEQLRPILFMLQVHDVPLPEKFQSPHSRART